MFVCSSCNETHTDGPICSVCKQQYDFACSGVTEAGYRRLGDRRSVWRCVRCKASPCASPIPVSPSPTQLDKMQDQLNSILHQLALLATVVEDIKSIKSDISDLKTSIEMAHDRTDKLASNVNTLTAKVTSVEKIAADIPSLQKEVARLNNEINMRDQWARANNIEIKGLPQLKNENLLDLAIKVGSVIGQQIKKEDVNYIARVPTRSTTLPKPIIVSFNNRYMKENIVAAARKCKLNTLDIGFSTTSVFYVNDHLTQASKVLLAKAKSLAKDNNFKYIWVKHSKIMARKSDSAPVFFIQSEKDLEKIKK